MCSRNERLNFYQQRPRSFHTTKYRRSRTQRLRLRQEERGWLLNRFETGRHHFENAEFICRTKAVLDCSNDPVGMLPRTLKIQDRIDDMLQSLWPGDSSIFRNVTDKE